jgi:hypothetical protein
VVEPPADDESDLASRSVFVVHGRNLSARDSFFSFLRALHLRPLEWGALLARTGQASPHIDDVLRAAFQEARAVLVLFTPDDRAQLRDEYGQGPSDAATRPDDQARANVLFEAGMAMGRDPNRTVLVELGHVRPFSDLAGRHVLRMDNSAQKRHELAQRLRTAGLPVDTSGSDWLAVGDFTPPNASASHNPNPARPTLPASASGSFVDGPLTLTPGRRTKGPFGITMSGRIANANDGPAFSMIAVRATFTSGGDIVGSATGIVSDLAPGVSKVFELTGDDQVDPDAEVELQVDSKF